MDDVYESRGGFTLLEVLAAMTVAALGLLVLLQTDGLNSGRVLHASRLAGATHLARERMDEVFSRGLSRAEEPEATAGEGVYTLTTEVGETEFSGVREVRLTVMWREGVREESYSVVAYLLE